MLFICVTFFYFIVWLLRSIYFACDNFKRKLVFSTLFFKNVYAHSKSTRVDRVTQIHFWTAEKTHFISVYFLVLFCALSIIVSRDRNDGSFGIGFQNLIHNIIVQFISKEIYIAIIFCCCCCWLLNLSFSCLFTRFAGFIFFLV